MAMQRMMMSGASSSSASSGMSLKNYDVFVSFRGEDTRKNFTSHLLEALKQKKVNVYVDYKLEKGDEISPALISAIEESRASVIIFSENYAASKWCLDELTKILECKRDRGQVVIPVFYNIDPSHVRKQTGSYEQALGKHELDLKHIKDKVQKWRISLTEGANLAGWDSRTSRTEAEFVKDIVKDVLHKLNLLYPIELNGLVGIEGNLAQIESLLDIGSREVKTIGIWGMGGLGKTVLATALYGKLSSQFEGQCFLANVKEEAKKHGLSSLRKKLFSELLEDERLCLDLPKAEPLFLMDRLKRKKVFVVLDDVSTSDQLEDLIVDCSCLGLESRVIVTARDKHVFSRVDEIYEVKELNSNDSLQLFCLNAFNEKHPRVGYEELTESAIAYCKGIPLALRVLGAHLCSRSKEAWESELRKLQKIPKVEIHNVLRSSYDDLDHTQKDIFLDIACFLKGKPKDDVTNLLEACGFFPTIGIEILLDKALITISKCNTIEMHDLIQEMGWQIVRQESIKDPSRRSRLLEVEEVYDVLKYNKGSEVVEGLMLDVSEIEDLCLNSDTFAKMINLRYLIFYSGKFERRNLYLPYGLESLPNKLRYLRWDGYCLPSLPSTFCAEMLVEISMQNSHLEKLWDGVQNLVSLKEIDLSNSKHLTEVPNFSKATNLEHLFLDGCESLCQVHPAILSLQKLTHLSLTDCRKIESIQTCVHLKSLRILKLNNCSSLKEFSLTSEEMEELWLDGTGLHVIPSSIWLNKKLRYLYLGGCENLNSRGKKLYGDTRLRSLQILDLSGCKQLNASNLCFILDGLRSLTDLSLRNCCNLQTLPDSIGLFSSLKWLDLSGSTVENLSMNIKSLLMLRELHLDNCRQLVSLPELPPYLQVLSAINCTSLETIFTTTIITQAIRCSISFLLNQGFPLADRNYAIFPGARVPNGFGLCTAPTSITIPHLPQSNLCGFILCLVLSSLLSNAGLCYAQCFISKYGETVGNIHSVLSEDSNRTAFLIGATNWISDHVLLWYCDIHDLPGIQEGRADDHYNISFKFNTEQYGSGEMSDREIKGCGVHPIYASEYQQGLELMLCECDNTMKYHSDDIVELEPKAQSEVGIDEKQTRAFEIGVRGSNHDTEDYQELTRPAKKERTSYQIFL